MVHNHKRLRAVASSQILPDWLTMPEDLFVRRIHDHGYLFGQAAARHKDPPPDLAAGDYLVRKSQAPLLKLFEHPNRGTIVPRPEDSCHQFGHGIVEVKDDLGSK